MTLWSYDLLVTFSIKTAPSGPASAQNSMALGYAVRLIIAALL
ncbi:MAG TPA: hypothetical protein VJ972_11955 [Anaerolineales bacterium]|nr:hypothetical protein [Anaerolineales bacterium]